MNFEACPNGSIQERKLWMRQRQSAKRIENIRRRSRRIEQVFSDVCREWDVTRVQLLGRTRLHSVLQARGQACRILREFGLSYCQIGHALNLHHSTVIYHCSKGVL